MWREHRFSQRNKATNKAVGWRLEGRGSVGTKIEKGMGQVIQGVCMIQGVRNPLPTLNDKEVNIFRKISRHLFLRFGGKFAKKFPKFNTSKINSPKRLFPPDISDPQSPCYLVLHTCTSVPKLYSSSFCQTRFVTFHINHFWKKRCCCRSFLSYDIKHLRKFHIRQPFSFYNLISLVTFSVQCC